MVIQCEGSAADVLKRLEHLADESRDLRFPYASEPLALQGYQLKATSDGAYLLTVEVPGRHVFNCVTTITVVSDTFGTTLRYVPALSPGFVAASVRTAALPMVLTFLVSFGKPFNPQPYLIFLVGGALFAGLGTLFGTGALDATLPRIDHLLRRVAQARTLGEPA